MKACLLCTGNHVAYLKPVASGKNDNNINILDVSQNTRFQIYHLFQFFQAIQVYIITQLCMERWWLMLKTNTENTELVQLNYYVKNK